MAADPMKSFDYISEATAFMLDKLQIVIEFVFFEHVITYYTFLIFNTVCIKYSL